MTTLARSVHELLDHARRSHAQDDLRDLGHALRVLGRSLPAERHRHLLDLAAACDDAAHEQNRTGRDLSHRLETERRIRNVLDKAGSALLDCDPTAATPFRPTAMPVTPAEIMLGTLAYNIASMSDPDAETAAIRGGRPAVHVVCSSDSSTGWRLKALISSGVETDLGFVEAHPRIVHRFACRDGRLNAAENTRRALWRKNPARSRLVVPRHVPVRWINDPRP